MNKWYSKKIYKEQEAYLILILALYGIKYKCASSAFAYSYVYAIVGITMTKKLSFIIDPSHGRFLNPDNISYLEPETIGGLNLYIYALNNPVMYCDPTGHLTISSTIGLFLILLIVLFMLSIIYEHIQHTYFIEDSADDFFKEAWDVLFTTMIKKTAKLFNTIYDLLWRY